MLTEEEMGAYLDEEVRPWWRAIKKAMPDLPDAMRGRLLVRCIRDPFYWKDERKKADKKPAAKKEEKKAGQETLEGDVKPDKKPQAEPEMIGVKVTGEGTYNNKTTLKKYKLQWDKDAKAWTGTVDPETFEVFKEWAEDNDMKVESVAI